MEDDLHLKMTLINGLPIGIKHVPVLTQTKQGLAPERDRAEHQGQAKHRMQPREGVDQAEYDARPTDQAEQTVRDIHTCCDTEWDKLLGFLKRTDQIVLRIIAHAQGDPISQIQLDGKTVRSLETEWRVLRSDEHRCKKRKCEEENAKLLEIIGRNIAKITTRDYQQEGNTSHEEER